MNVDVEAVPEAGTRRRWWQDRRKFYRPRFPSVEMLDTAAAMFEALPRWDGHEGPRPRVLIGAGTVAVARRDLARANRTAERAIVTRTKTANQVAIVVDRTGELPERPPSRREIRRWSRKSRANMRRCFSELDYRPLYKRGHVPAMVTLTYPGDWLALAPTGRHAKAHLFAFRRRYERTWGFLPALWKIEFQRRGAPHFHIMLVPPHGMTPDPAGAVDATGAPVLVNFRQWLSWTWADVCGADEASGERARHLAAGTGIDYANGLKATDPRRVADYFEKHGAFKAKDYQNVVPGPYRAPGAGPGRFWGYWRLTRPVRGVAVDPAHADQITRMFRRYADAQGVTKDRADRAPGYDPTDGATYRLTGAMHKASRKTMHEAARKAAARKTERGEAAGRVAVTRPAAGRVAVTHEVNAARYEGGYLRPTDWQIIGLAGAQEIAHQTPRGYRNVRRRVRRMRGRGGAGWLQVNSGADVATAAARWLDWLADDHDDRLAARQPGEILAMYRARQDHRPVMADLTSPGQDQPPQDQQEGEMTK